MKLPTEQGSELTLAMWNWGKRVSCVIELTRLCDFWCVPSRRFIADSFSMDSDVSEPEVDDKSASELDCDDEPSDDLLSLEFESLSSSLSGGPESTVVFVPV